MTAEQWASVFASRSSPTAEDESRWRTQVANILAGGHDINAALSEFIAHAHWRDITVNARGAQEKRSRPARKPRTFEGKNYDAGIVPARKESKHGRKAA